MPSVSLAGQQLLASPESATFNPVSWDYFQTIGARAVSGRSFTAQDDQDHPGVVVVNESFARKYFPNETALGQRLQLGAPARIWNNERLTTFEIVGIVGDVKSAGLNAEAEPTYYVPASQAPLQNMTVLVRTQNDPTALVPAIARRGVVHRSQSTHHQHQDNGKHRCR